MARNPSTAVLDRPRSSARQRSGAGERPGPLTIRLADRHRWVGIVAAITAAGAFAALWVPNLGSRVATGATGTSYLLIGLVLSGLLAAATVTRRGVLMAGAALLVAVGPWGPEFFIQILFFVYAVFLMVMVARQTRATSSGDNLDQRARRATPRRGAGGGEELWRTFTTWSGTSRKSRRRRRRRAIGARGDRPEQAFRTTALGGGWLCCTRIQPI
ncbi:MAG: hypothetical protein E6G01_17675 [Actinobacteria bacterium]|nr:MAG: hypothetical protein E6G01_17675 [Actinomycetota bacterium]